MPQYKLEVASKLSALAPLQSYKDTFAPVSRQNLDKLIYA